MSRSQVPRRDERAEARDVRERFLAAIAERVTADRIAELHLFPPIRQGGVETGIAVIAAHPELEADVGAGPPPGHEDRAEPSEPPHPTDPDRTDVPRTEAEPPGGRLTVYRATYRWTRKGPDRGRWEVDVRAEADAPLETVEDIVRGVHRRAGGEAEPERLPGDAVRAALAERAWATPT